MIATSGEEILSTKQATEHLHESNCHHIKIAHCDASGQIHVGFISEDGDLTCYAPVATPQEQLEHKVPKGSLFNVCLKSAPGKFGLHRLTPQCRESDSTCWTDDTHFLLEPVSFNECQIRNRNCASDSTASTHSHAHHTHHHTDSETGKSVMKHDGHLDVFVNNVNGDLDLHCLKDANSETCHVHGSLQRVKQESIPSQDWLDLFVFANQTSTSTIKVYKGLCCKKEIPKIDQLLHDICLAHDLKIQIDPKQKLVTVWHGSDVKSWLGLIYDRLCTGVFRCEIATVNGEAVTSAVVSSLTDQVVDEILLHASPHDEESGNVRIQYFASQQHEVLRRIVGSNAACTLLQCGGQPVYSHTVAIAKGLCCKKEIPKVEFALKDVAGLLCVRVHPKDKFVVVYTTLHDFIVDTVHTSLTVGGFTLLEKSVEEKHEHGHAHDDDHGHSHTAKVLPPRNVQQMLPSADGLKLTRSVLSVKGVCCAAEVPSVLAVCNEIPGVSFASVSVISKQVYFKHSAEDAHVASLVAKRLTDNGFGSMVLVNGGESRAEQMRQVSQAPIKTERILLTKWYVILATVLWLMAWFSYIGGSAEPLKYLAIVAVALTLPKIAHKGWLSLRRRIMDINILMSIAVIGALAIQDFHEAATVTVIFSWSEWLEERASRRAKGAMQALVDLKPDVARTEDGQEISVDAVYVDQVLVVRSGDKIPVDGVLLSVTCDCDESNLTGESRPVAKQEGDLLNAGTLNVSPFTVKMRCTALAEDSAVNRMILLVEEAAQSRSPTEQVVERVAKFYTPIVVLVALLLATIPWSQGDEIGREYLNIALTLLVVACPCALIISTPITYVCAMAQAATFGVLVKGGKYLETLAVLNCLCCDKTGTLTKGSFDVTDYLMLTAAGAEEMAFELLMKIEQHATHPIAQALARFSESKLTKLTDVEVYELELLPGTGVRATLSTGSVAVVVNKLDFPLPAPLRERIDAWLEAQVGKTICWLVVDGNVLLGCSAADKVRDSAFPFVTQLIQQCKVRVVVLTGDNPSSAELLQQEIPLLTSVFAGLTPEGKVDHVKRLREEGHIVGVCGDGVNDAPAFSIASIGIAMGVSGAPLAIETADVALMDNDLTKIPKLLKLARRTKRVIIQNITFALSTKMVMLGLTFAGMISLGVAIAVDVGSMLLVTLNGVRLLERAHKRPTSSKPPVIVDDISKSMAMDV